MEYLFCDVLIIGSGAAGLRAAISARQKGLDVCVVSKQSPGKASCTILSAGVFAATQEGTSLDQHLNRTLQVGRGINQRELVKVLVDEGPARLTGLPFSRWPRTVALSFYRFSAARLGGKPNCRLNSRLN